MRSPNHSSTGTSRAFPPQVVAVLVLISVVAIVLAVLIVCTPSEKQQQSVVATSVNPTSANTGESHVNMTICVDSVGGLDSSAVLEVLLWYAGRDVFRARDARANSEGTEITCWFDFENQDILPGSYHLSINWRRAGWIDNGLEECFTLVGPERDSAEDGIIDSYSEICMDIYYQIEVSGQVVGEEWCSCRGRGVIHRGIDGKHDLDSVQYELFREDLHDENQGGQTFTRTYLEEDSIYEQVIWCDEDYEDCPIFEPDYAGSMRCLCNYLYGPDDEQSEEFEAMVPSLGDRKVVVKQIDPEPGFNMGVLIVETGERIYASFNPESCGMARVYIPSRDLEIYLADYGYGRSGAYYVTLAYIFSGQKNHVEAIENAEKAIEVGGNEDAAKAIIKEAEEGMKTHGL